MTRSILIPIVLSLCACGTKSGVGATGATGATGAQGAPGAAGVCDLSSCPAITSIDGLAGGTIHGASQFGDALTVSRVVVTKGTASTSTNAFYCGTTSFVVDGSAAKTTPVTGGEADVSGPWIANKYCQDTCSSNTAHVCTSSEFIKFQSLRAFSGTEPSDFGSNHGVPMPMYSASPPSGFDRGWVYASDGLSSCQGFSTGSVGNGVAFVPGSYGFFHAEPCTATHPLYCCD